MAPAATWRAYAATAAILGMAATSLAMMIASSTLLDHYNLRGPVLLVRLVAAMLAAPLLAIPWVALITWVLARSAFRERLGAALFCVALAAPGAHFSLDAANVTLDRSKPERHVVRFVERVTERKGSGYAVISSWRNPDETVSLTSDIRFGSVKPGDSLEVTVHRGALGWDYIAAIRVPATSSSGIEVSRE